MWVRCQKGVIINIERVEPYGINLRFTSKGPAGEILETPYRTRLQAYNLVNVFERDNLTYTYVTSSRELQMNTLIRKFLPSSEDKRWYAIVVQFTKPAVDISGDVELE